MLLLATSGCIRIYQPLSGMHRPVVVDTRAPNLRDVNLTVQCISGGLLSPGEAGTLCQKVTTLFENQGAIVQTVDNGGAFFDEAPAAVSDAPRTDLTLTLRATELHRSHHPLSWALFVVSFTVLPGINESSFVQEVTVRDQTGFLLVQDTLEGRIVERAGAGPWLGNKIVDLFREKEERIAGPVAERELSADLYRQLSQILFNAKIQREVLLESVPTAGVP